MSLWELLSKYLERYVEINRTLHGWWEKADQRSLDNSETTAGFLRRDIGAVVTLADELGLVATKSTATIFAGTVSDRVRSGGKSELAGGLDNLMRCLKEEALGAQFMSIRVDRLSLWDATFGPEVDAAFPSAICDIQEGNKCFALERYTACVFHMMRATEISLRVLAWDRRVMSRQQANVEDWHKIISSLTGYVNGVGGEPRAKWKSGLARDAQLRFYQGAMLEFRSMNEYWRRHVSHARPDEPLYDEGQASSAREHTKQFLTHLATRIRESTRMPIYWVRG